MSETPATTSGDEDFRWQAFFQRTTDPLFVLNRQCYLLFVNRAWEELTGLSANSVKRLSCRRQRSPSGRASWKTLLSHLLTPTPEIRAGQAGRTRRFIPARGSRVAAWWSIDFLPLTDENGLRAILGKIIPDRSFEIEPGEAPVPQGLATRRAQFIQRYRLDHLRDRLPVMRRLLDQARLAATRSEPVLLVGDTGTGKEWLARTIHYQSDRRKEAFAALDCQRIPPVLIETILLGESESAKNIGSVYLREPSFLASETQARLLELLELRREDASAVPRIFAGMTEESSSELTCALSAIRITVPSLRERIDDLPHLIDHQIQRQRQERSSGPSSLTPDAWELILSYPWPGNLRELVQVIRHAFESCEEESIDARHLPRSMRPDQDRPPRKAQSLDLKGTMEEVERRLITLALTQSGGERQKAADNLQIWRAVLLRRMKALNIDIPAPQRHQNKSRKKKETDSGEDEEVSF